MLTALLAVQAGINVALVLALYLLRRERQAAARLALDREARLGTLADDLCALGRSLLSRAPAGAIPRPTGADSSAPGPESPPAPPRPEVSARGATCALDAPMAPEATPVSLADPVCPPIAICDTQAAAIQEAAVDDQASRPREPSERLRVIATLLDRGLTVADVAAQTATPEGEVEVFRNLRRSAKRLSASQETALLRD
jgi:hypothetical protein